MRAFPLLWSAGVVLVYLLLDPQRSVVDATFFCAAILTWLATPLVLGMHRARLAKAGLQDDRRSRLALRTAWLIAVLGPFALPPVPTRLVTWLAPEQARRARVCATFGFGENWLLDEKPMRIGKHGDTPHPVDATVLFIGDSVIYGLGVDPAQAAVRILESRLPGTQCLNGGVPGFGPDQEVIYSEFLVPRVKPKVVVLSLFSGNDLDDMESDVANGGLYKALFVPDGAGLTLVHTPVRSPFESFECDNALQLLPILKPFRWLNPRGMVGLAQELCPRRRVGAAEVDVVLDRLLARFDANVRAAGAIPLYLHNFDQGARDVRPSAAGHRAKYARMQRHLAPYAANVLDMNAWLAARNIALEPLFQIDRSHLTPEGNAQLANALCDFLRDRAGLTCAP